MEFIYGVLATFLVFIVVGAYLNIMRKLTDIGGAVGYIAKREMDFEEAEKKVNEDMEKAQSDLNRVYTN